MFVFNSDRYHIAEVCVGDAAPHSHVLIFFNLALQWRRDIGKEEERRACDICIEGQSPRPGWRDCCGMWVVHAFSFLRFSCNYSDAVILDICDGLGND